MWTGGWEYTQGKQCFTPDTVGGRSGVQTHVAQLSLVAAPNAGATYRQTGYNNLNVCCHLVITTRTITSRPDPLYTDTRNLPEAERNIIDKVACC